MLDKVVAPRLKQICIDPPFIAAAITSAKKIKTDGISIDSIHTHIG